MAVVNITGAQGTATWDIVTDEYHITGNTTINAGATITISVGANQNPIRFDGDFNITPGSSGKIVANGTSVNRIRWQPNGSPSIWDATAYPNVFLNINSTSASVFDYNDFYMVGFQDNHSTTNTSVTNCRSFFTRSGTGFTLIPASGTNTYSNLQSHSGGATEHISISPSGGTNSFSNIYSSGAGTGFKIFPTGGTNTVSNLKAVRCTNGYLFGGTGAVTGSNMVAQDCEVPFSGSIAATSTLTFVVSDGSCTATTSGFTANPAAATVTTLDEAYIRCHSLHGVLNGSGVASRLAVTNSVIYNDLARFVASSGIGTCTSSGNDIVWPQRVSASSRCVSAGTTDNDYMAGANGGWIGEVPVPATGMLDDWTSADLFLNVDNDSGNTTSTHAPVMYSGLASNRTNARTSPNKALTISGLAVSGITNSGATFDFTTGIKSKSRILLSQSSGITRLNATTISPWKYDGLLNPDSPSDFTLPVTAHQHVITNLDFGTYYYRVECVDPCGRHFLSTEASFSTGHNTPTVDAGQDETILPGDGMYLTGFEFSEDETVTAAWTNTVKPLGSTVNIASASSLKTTATYDKIGLYTFQLQVTGDISGLSATDTVDITVSNTPPVVFAGQDETIDYSDVLYLDGYASAIDPITYTWTLTASPVGSAVVIADAANHETTATYDKVGNYTFQLLADDGFSTATDSVTITVANQTPLVDVGPDQSMHFMESLNLRAVTNDDTVPSALTYLWTKTSGPGTLTFGTPAAQTTTVSASAMGAYVVRCTVDDGTASAFDEMTLTVTTPAGGSAIHKTGYLNGFNIGA